MTRDLEVQLITQLDLNDETLTTSLGLNDDLVDLIRSMILLVHVIFKYFDNQ